MFGYDHDDEPQRPRGRRHQPRDMANDGGNPILGTQATTSATKANNDRYAQQREQMQDGHSFLDQMYKSERPGRNSTGLAGGGKRRASGQQDNLNLFAWNNGSAASPNGNAVPTGRAHGNQGGSSAPAKPQSTTPAQTGADAGQRQRDVEAQKFEMHNDGGFLCFSENVKSKPQQGKATQAPAKASAAYGSPQHGMMDALMRDDTKTKSGAAPERSSKRHVAQTKAHDGPDFAGFPGMGARSGEKQFNHIRRKEVESNVFLPEAIPGLAPEDGAPRRGVPSTGASSRQPPPPAAPQMGEEADEDMDLDAVMAAIDPSQLSDEELQHYVAYLRERQGGQQSSHPEWIEQDQYEDGYPAPSGGAAGNHQDDYMSSQAQRVKLYQQRQRGE